MAESRLVDGHFRPAHVIWVRGDLAVEIKRDRLLVRRGEANDSG